MSVVCARARARWSWGTCEAEECAGTAFFSLVFFLLPFSCLLAFLLRPSHCSGNLSYDEVVSLLAEISMITSQFAKYDVSRVGRTTLDYSQLLHIIYSIRA